jgi:hypothetical protein
VDAARSPREAPVKAHSREFTPATGIATGPMRRHNACVRIERTRENVFTVTATSQELSALVAAARMALEAMRGAPEPPPAEAVAVLERVIGDFDRARDRLMEASG